MNRLSVISPAWNEEGVLPDFFDSLLRQQDILLEIILIINGSTDNSRAIAEFYASKFAEAGHLLKILQTETANKCAALNAGDRLANVFPRAYIDVDVTLTSNALYLIADALAIVEPRLASPRIKFKSGDGSTQRLGDLLAIMPPFDDDVAGGGFYAVNERGRGRWRQFPDVIADDAFACSHFSRNERLVISGATFQTRFPTRENLLPVLTRWEMGRLQLRRLNVSLSRTSFLEKIGRLALYPGRWSDVIEMARIKGIARRSAKRSLAQAPFSWPKAD